jgi:hypothetical protein
MQRSYLKFSLPLERWGGYRTRPFVRGVCLPAWLTVLGRALPNR